MWNQNTSFLYKCVRRLIKLKFASYLGAVMGKLKNIKYLQVLSRFLLCSRFCWWNRTSFIGHHSDNFFLFYHYFFYHIFSDFFFFLISTEWRRKKKREKIHSILYLSPFRVHGEKKTYSKIFVWALRGLREEGHITWHGDAIAVSYCNVL